MEAHKIGWLFSVIIGLFCVISLYSTNSPAYAVGAVISVIFLWVFISISELNDRLHPLQEEKKKVNKMSEEIIVDKRMGYNVNILMGSRITIENAIGMFDTDSSGKPLKVKESGNGATIPFLKRYIGKTVIVFVIEKAKGGEAE